MLQLDAAALAQRLPLGALVPALREMFIAGCEVPQRHTHRIGETGTVLLMPAWQAGRHLGVKTINIFPGNSALGLPGLHAIYLLFDANTGVPVALMDGSELTARRTAAASALAAHYLARADVQHLVVLGSGRVATLLPEAYRQVRPKLQRVTVWNHRPEGAERLAAQLREQGFNAQASTDLEAAVRSACIVSCATLARQALVQGAWLAPGTHLDLIGSFAPDTREADAACFTRSRVFVDTEEALLKAGDLVQAAAEGQFNPARLQATLAQLCRGQHAGRQQGGDVTVFKAVGSAQEDLAAAELALASAVTPGG
ncbi:ornithine cyclodeaminase [beta proteobacterium AAP121]|nr:ornithine cyclodeaminase [beta proteobacterium AAP65]KPF98628.1 ornithine cyclodeaminase [beta proteobacterium AAP121]